MFTDIEPCLIARLLLFCYSLDDQYPKTLTLNILPSSCKDLVSNDVYGEAVTDSFAAAKLAIEMHALGGRFGMESLKLTSVDNFKKAFRTIGKGGSAPRALQNEQECTSIFERVYSTTLPSERGLRDILFVAVVGHVEKAAFSQNLFDYIKLLFEQFPDLAYDAATFWQKRSLADYSATVAKARVGVRDDVDYDVENVQVIIDPENSLKKLCQSTGVSTRGKKMTVVFEGDQIPTSTLAKNLGLQDGDTLAFRLEGPTPSGGGW